MERYPSNGAAAALLEWLIEHEKLDTENCRQIKRKCPPILWR